MYEYMQYEGTIKKANLTFYTSQKRYEMMLHN